MDVPHAQGIVCKTAPRYFPVRTSAGPMFKLHHLLMRQPSRTPVDDDTRTPADTGSATDDPVARQGLFVIGAARTGTTILQGALNDSREIFLFGEPAFHRDPGTPDFASRYNGMHRAWGNQETKSSYCPRLFEHDARWHDYLEKLARHYRYVGSKIVINPHDATAECSELFDFQCRRFYTSHQIFTFRNPLDTLMSTRGLSELNGGRIASCIEVLRGYFLVVQLYFQAVRTLPHVHGWFHESVGPDAFRALGTSLDLPLSNGMAYYDSRKIRHYTMEQVPESRCTVVSEAMDLYGDFRTQASAGFALPQIEQNNGHLDPAHFTPLGRLSWRVTRFLDALDKLEASGASE
ncbi:hypothetical protein AB7849_03840 [Rhodanobacter sp. 115]|uniref:hypothetical protein n=1 Tax=Rhodanobacter sp. FW021-MT20 TaxID=1162282 RepID=UPI0034E528CF